MSHYLQRAAKRTKVLIRDEKKDITIAQLSRIKSFDKKEYEKVLSKASGIFTKELHPKWKDSKEIVTWLTKSRLSDDRSF